MRHVGRAWALHFCNNMTPYGSHFLSDTESHYATVELELLAVAWAMQKCWLFHHGLPELEIVIDHQPLVPILNNYTLDMGTKLPIPCFIHRMITISDLSTIMGLLLVKNQSKQCITLMHADCIEEILSKKYWGEQEENKHLMCPHQSCMWYTGSSYGKVVSYSKIAFQWHDLLLETECNVVRNVLNLKANAWMTGQQPHTNEIT